MDPLAASVIATTPRRPARGANPEDAFYATHGRSLRPAVAAAPAFAIALAFLVVIGLAAA